MALPEGSRDRLRIAIGVLLSVYGLGSVVHTIALLRHGVTPLPDVLRPSVTEWWPIPRLWPSALAFEAAMYLGWMAKGSLLLGGVGTAAGHRPAMRLAIAALFALAALGVLTGAPTALALALGRMSVDVAEWSRHFGRPVPAEAAAGYLRMGGWLVLTGIMLTALVQVATAVWLKRELARGTEGASGTTPRAGPLA